MKPVYIVAACVVAFVALTSAQVPVGPVAGVAAPIVPPVFPPMFAGMPFPFLGPFGFPFPFLPGFGLGLGGLGLLGLGGLGGLGGIGGIGRLGGIGRVGLLRGKREVEAPIKCKLSTKSIDCVLGVGQRMMCDVEPRLEGVSDSLKLRLVGLGVTGKSESGVKYVDLVSKKDETFTFVNPTTHKPVLLSVFWGGVADWKKTGFAVKDEICWNSLVKSVGEDGRVVNVDLVVV